MELAVGKPDSGYLENKVKNYKRNAIHLQTCQECLQSGIPAGGFVWLGPGPARTAAERSGKGPRSLCLAETGENGFGSEETEINKGITPFVQGSNS